MRVRFDGHRCDCDGSEGALCLWCLVRAEGRILRRGPPVIPMHPLTYALTELRLNGLLAPAHNPERFVTARLVLPFEDAPAPDRAVPPGLRRP